MRKALLTVISFTLCLYITSCSQSSKPEKARTIETIATDAQQTLSFNHEPLSIDPIGIGDIIVDIHSNTLLTLMARFYRKVFRGLHYSKLHIVRFRVLQAMPEQA